MSLLQKTSGRKDEGGQRTHGFFKQTLDNKPLISIITVVFNGEKYLEQTIQSVINQTYDNIEYIIIDGASTDNTIKIIKQYENKIDYWISEPDKGIYFAMNKGIDVANGQWLLFLGADDKLYNSNTVHHFSNYFKKDYEFINGKIIHDDNSTVKSKLNYKTLLHNTLHHQGTFYNKKLFNYFRYDLHCSIMADYELNLKLFLSKTNNYIIENTYIAKCRKDGISNIQINQSMIETNYLRKKYIKGMLNNILQFIYRVKFYIHQKLK